MLPEIACTWRILRTLQAHGYGLTLTKGQEIRQGMPLDLYRLGTLLVVCAFVLPACVGCASAAASGTTSSFTLIDAAPSIPTPRPTALPYPTATPAKTTEQITAGLATSRFLDGFHARQGVKCEGCHRGTSVQEPVSKEICLSCHGGSYTALQERTSSLTVNPHRSHIGQVACTYCHNVHSAFDYYCTQCHKKFTNTRFN